MRRKGSLTTKYLPQLFETKTYEVKVGKKKMFAPTVMLGVKYVKTPYLAADKHVILFLDFG